MTSSSLDDAHYSEVRDTQREGVARRVAELFDNDAQFRAAAPIPEVIEAASTPGLRLTQVFETIVEGYADRPALGQRARELVTDAGTGRTSVRLSPQFDTISYREFFDRALTRLPEPQRQHSVLPLLDAFRKPDKPIRGAAAPTDAFQAEVRAVGAGPDKDIPHISAELIAKYASDLRQLGLLR